MENATKPPIAMNDLRVLAKKMKVGMTVHLFFRKKHHSDVASVYKSATYRVDVSMPAIISDASVDEYAWLSPEERPDDSEPFPEDGLHGCDLYEYSYVDISGGPDPDPVDFVMMRASMVVKFFFLCHFFLFRFQKTKCAIALAPARPSRGRAAAFFFVP